MFLLIKNFDCIKFLSKLQLSFHELSGSVAVFLMEQVNFTQVCVFYHLSNPLNIFYFEL